MEQKNNTNEKVSLLKELNREFYPSLNQINKSLHSNKFSIRNRLLSIYDDHSFVKHIHSSSFQQYPLTANLRCGSWYVHPTNHWCYFKSTDGHFQKWNFNLRRFNPNTLKLIIKTKGIIIVDSTRKGKVYPDALQRTIPIWCHVLNNIFYILSKQNNVNNLNNLNEINTNISLKMPSWITDSETEQIETLTNKQWIKKVLSSNIINELFQIQNSYDNKLYLEPFWIDRFSDINAIKLEIKQRINTDNILPVILLTASRPIHVLEMTEKHKQTFKQITMIEEINKLNFEYIQGAGDDHEHWSKGITPQIFWKYYKSFLKCYSNESCVELLENVTLQDTLNEEKKDCNDNDDISMNELIVDCSSNEILNKTNNMLYVMCNEKVFDGKNINVLDVIKILCDKQESVCKIVNYVILCVSDRELMQKCMDLIQKENMSEIKIGVYFVVDNKKYKHSLKDALELIFKDFDDKKMNKIWIFQDKKNYNINVIGCIAASLILHCIVNSVKMENRIDYKFWVKTEENNSGQQEVVYLSKTKIRNVLDKFQFMLNDFHPSRLLMKQINNYFLSF
eukprot:217403_1